MSVALDHVLILCDEGAPQASALANLGLTEGSSNAHLGQGTANRRFFFHNAYLELLWVSDLAEARREPAFRTRLWERWLRRSEGACPFGVALRPKTPGDENAAPPFPTWAYYAPYLPPKISIGIAVATPLREPEFLYLPHATPPGAKQLEPIVHDLPIRDLTAVRIGIPRGDPASPAAKAAHATDLVSFFASEDYVMELNFEGTSNGDSADLRPELPLVLRW